MLAWLTQNWGTLLIGMILLLAVGAVIASMVRRRRQGKSSCGCNCAGCAMCGACHTAPEKK